MRQRYAAYTHTRRADTLTSARNTSKSGNGRRTLGIIRTPPPRRERRMCLVDIVQDMWRTGEIPQDMGWTDLVLIPKGTTITRGIGLL